MPAPQNLVNLSGVGKDYAARTILDGVTLGVATHERIGVVGANGQGKSTLLGLLSGAVEAERGEVIRRGDLQVRSLEQQDRLDPARHVQDVLLGGRPAHEWTADSALRAVLDGLLGGVALSALAAGLDTEVRALSGGERRRTTLARVLIEPAGLLLLDEPTNHLDIDAITWLARHLAKRRGALVVVTHDRWFLDAVCTQTWEVADGTVNRYDGGYAAYVLARAERERQAAAHAQRQRQLLRKELAWLQRGPPARTSKPRFRIAAANALIADEPPARDGTELARFTNTRLGNRVLELEHVSYAYGRHPVIRDLTWRVGPGERVALVGANGRGKSTLLDLLEGVLTPDTGRIERGSTVVLARLSQSPEEITGNPTVLAAITEVRGSMRLADGRELTASRLAERLGFRGERQHTRVSGLSGGELRRLTLIRLLMSEPNVLLLDEPTNDLDIETLQALEDLLDRWPGTLIVVSHDRYFIERVCDSVFTLDRRAGVRHLPGGIDQYLAESERHASERQPDHAGGETAGGGTASTPAVSEPKPGAVIRDAQRQLKRLERELERSAGRERELQAMIAANGSDHLRLRELVDALAAATRAREELEVRWLDTATLLEDRLTP